MKSCLLASSERSVTLYKRAFKVGLHNWNIDCIISWGKLLNLLQSNK